MNKTIDLTINKEGLAHNIQKAKENNIIIPTIAQMQNPDLIPEKIKEKLSHTGLWDVDPVNLFRINWHNEAKESGGLYQKTPNYVEIPSSVSGVPCRILAMSGKWFPTGCHKVGASEDAIFKPGQWRDDINGLLDFASKNAMWQHADTLARARRDESPKILGMSTCSSEFTDARTILLARMVPYTPEK